MGVRRRNTAVFVLSFGRGVEGTHTAARRSQGERRRRREGSARREGGPKGGFFGGRTDGRTDGRREDAPGGASRKRSEGSESATPGGAPEGEGGSSGIFELEGGGLWRFDGEGRRLEGLGAVAELEGLLLGRRLRHGALGPLYY